MGKINFLQVANNNLLLKLIQERLSFTFCCLRKGYKPESLFFCLILHF